MADNITIPASGTGTATPVVATDDVTGVHYQRVKLVDGTLDATTAIAAGNGTNGGALRVTVASDSTGSLAVTNAGTFAVQASAPTATSGGPTTYHLVSANTTNATNVKASAGQLYGWYIYNNNTSMRKVAFHNTAGTPTAGTSIYFSIPVPPQGGTNVWFRHGIPFSTGIAFTTVTDITDAGATAVGTSDLTINLWYA